MYKSVDENTNITTFQVTSDKQEPFAFIEFTAGHTPTRSDPFVLVINDARTLFRLQDEINKLITKATDVLSAKCAQNKIELEAKSDSYGHPG